MNKLRRFLAKYLYIIAFTLDPDEKSTICDIKGATITVGSSLGFRRGDKIKINK